MVCHTQTRHGIFLCIDNQLCRIRIKTIGLKSININLSQRGRHVFFHQITERILFRSPSQNITSIQFTRSIEKLIITLLFRETKTDIISISLALVLYRKLNSKTFTGINHLIGIAIYEAVYANHQHSRFHRHRNRFIGSCFRFSLFQSFVIGKQTRRERSIRSSICYNLGQYFILWFHIHILIYTSQPLHI